MEPPQKQDSYAVAYSKAQKDLEGLNILERARSAGFVVETKPEEVVRLDFLGQNAKLIVGERVVVDAETGEPLPLWSQILILHYLRDVKEGVEPAGRWITFKEVPSGEFYLSAFNRRSKDLAIKFFGHNPDLLHEVAPRLGGERFTEVGDVSYLFRVFPKVPVVLVMYRADEEFPPDANILFDATIPEFLCTEDIAVISTMLVVALGKLAQKIKG
ncbi:MAG TPA: DUF3786 domain-containing protein [Proteobacteria bacterium]|nr:DUF3786 domain-containing protein [Pseudomonadota bacterium]